MSKGESCESCSCVQCGNTIDRVILANQTPEQRRFWKDRTDREASRPLSRGEKTLLGYEEEAIRFSF